MGVIKLVVPTINVNDEKATLGSKEVENLEFVKKGQVLCCFETSKSTEDFVSDYDGYVVWLYDEYEEIKIGKEFCYIYDTLDEAKNHKIENKAPQLPEGFMASKKAIEYAASIGFDITLIQKKGMIKTEDIDDYLNKGKVQKQELIRESSGERSIYKSNDVILVGGGGLCLLIVDAINLSREYNIVGIVDDYALKGEMRYGYEVLGPIEDTLKDLYDKGLRLAVNCMAAMESSTDNPLFFARRDIAKKIKSLGYLLPNIIHPNAKLEPSCRLGEGNVILSGANIGSCAVIGDNCYINTNTMVSHECVIGDGVKIAPGAILAGRIKVGANTLVGMGSTVYMNTKIGCNSILYNGVNVYKSVPDNTIVKTNWGGVINDFLPDSLNLSLALAA